MGKSLIKRLSLVGGQNPIEAAKRGCKIYYGPYVYNFFEVYKFLSENKIAEQIEDIGELSFDDLSNSFISLSLNSS